VVVAALSLCRRPVRSSVRVCVRVCQHRIPPTGLASSFLLYHVVVFLSLWQTEMNKTQTNNILRGDLIEVFEIIKGYKNIDKDLSLKYFSVQSPWSFVEIK